jgi:hypothetical protein
LHFCQGERRKVVQQRVSRHSLKNKNKNAEKGSREKNNEKE